ncbi:MAG: hypothetical protein ACC655_06420 [Rhodothermia bacterium]
MITSLGQFAAAIPASPKWVLNAHAVLGLDADYSVDRAKTLALARVLERGLGMTLKRAYHLATTVLRMPDDPQVWQLQSADRVATLVIDRERFLSNFAATLSFALEGYSERRRGRPRKKCIDGINAARAHGVDISLLQASLNKTPAERLRRLDEDVAFLNSLEVIVP